MHAARREKKQPNAAVNPVCYRNYCPARYVVHLVQLCGKNVMGAIIHFLAGFKACSTIWNSHPGTINWAERQQQNSHGFLPLPQFISIFVVIVVIWPGIFDCLQRKIYTQDIGRTRV